MALEGFRAVEVELDTANGWVAPVELSEGDASGRVVRVSVTDGGASVAPEGLGARLWFNARPDDPESSGGYVSMATVRGARTATFEAPAPAMPAGEAMLAVEVTHAGGSTMSLPFRATVARAPLNGSAPSTQDALAELREALSQIGSITDATKAANDAAKRASDAAAAASAPATASKAGLVKPGAFMAVGAGGALTLASGFLPVFLKDAAGKSPGLACMVVDTTSSPVSFYYDDGKKTAADEGGEPDGPQDGGE